MEMARSDKAIREKDELTYQLKKQKAINADQAVELKKEKQVNKALKKQVEKLRN